MAERKMFCLREVSYYSVFIFIYALQFLPQLRSGYERGDGMNHDYAHCSDYRKDCPKECFRAQLVRDLKQRTDLFGLPFTWMSFKGTKECKKEVTE